jgi:hypothetical protein
MSMVDGIFYASQHHNGLYSLAVFDRAQHKLSFETWGTLADRAVNDLWLATEQILTDYAVIVR